MKIKFFGGDTLGPIEKEVNAFIKGKRIRDVKTVVANESSYHILGGSYYILLVMYDEDDEK